MKPFWKHARETLDDVSEASTTVTATTQWATVALIGIAAVAIFALAVGLVSLSRARA